MLVSTVAALLMQLWLPGALGAFTLAVSRASLEQVPSHTSTEVIFTLAWHNVSGESAVPPMAEDDLLAVLLEPGVEWRTRLEPASWTLSSQQVAEGYGQPVLITGQYLGRDIITPRAWIISSDHRTSPVSLEMLFNSSSLHVSFVRENSAKDLAFYGILTTMTLASNLNMGMQLEFEAIKQSLLRPVGPITGFLAQFLVMPLSSYAVAQLGFSRYPLYQLGLFTLGTCPGGGNSNLWALLLGADVNLSVTMTFVSTLAAIGMMPLWMFTLGRRITAGGGGIQVPYQGIVSSLLALTAPSVIGMLLRWWKPHWRQYSDRSIRPMVGLLLFIFCTVGIWLNLEQFSLLALDQFLMGGAVVLLGFSLGAGLALVFRRPLPQVVTISLETGLQNGGLALLLLKASLPAPDGDVATLAVYAQVICQGLMLWPCLTGILITRCWSRRRQPRPKPLDGGVEGAEGDEGKEVVEISGGEEKRGAEAMGSSGRQEAGETGRIGPGVSMEDEGGETVGSAGEENLEVSTEDEQKETRVMNGTYTKMTPM